MNGKENKSQKKINLNWLAGVFDGEGSISLTVRSNINKNMLPTYELWMSVGNTEYELVEPFYILFGGHISSRKLKSGRTIYQWMCPAKKALNALKIILPYLKAPHRIEAAELAIKYQRGKVKGQHRGYKKGEIPVEYFEREKKYRKAMFKINHPMG